MNLCIYSAVLEEQIRGGRSFEFYIVKDGFSITNPSFVPTYFSLTNWLYL
jgi:hypothetical protein